MQAIAMIALLFGVLQLGRLGLMLLPTTTARQYRQRLESLGLVRLLGFGLFGMGVPLIYAARVAEGDHGQVYGWLEAIGWVHSGFGLWPLIAPASFRQAIEAKVLSLSEFALRMVGAANVILGLWMIYVGVVVLG